MATVYVRGSRDVLLQVLRQLPAAVAGTGPDPLGLGRQVREAAAAGLLESAKSDQAARAKGPRKPRGPVKRPRGLLSDAQDREWRTIYATRRNWLVAKFGMGEQEASRVAAKIAWADLKAQGAPTKKAAREREAALRARAEAEAVVLEGPARQVPEAAAVPASWWQRLLGGVVDGLTRAVVNALARFQ